jgi:hypothetical protein
VGLSDGVTSTNETADSERIIRRAAIPVKRG